MSALAGVECAVCDGGGTIEAGKQNSIHVYGHLTHAQFICRSDIQGCRTVHNYNNIIQRVY